MKYIVKSVGADLYLREREKGHYDLTSDINEAKEYNTREEAMKSAHLASIDLSEPFETIPVL